ncbi:trypsin-like serine protease [Streptomyces sp. NPDC048270]|uniref:trypsin-like serine protease n=1 Tax=Streptomyces sp. NPDC048270 TaxID=3154615 RepID=UPI0034004740
MNSKSFRRNTILGISLAVSGSLLVLHNQIRPGATESEPNVSFAAVAADRAAMVAQASISEATTEIYQAVQNDPGSGYAGVVMSTEEKGYKLSWKGEIPPTVASLIEAHRGKGINVSVAASRYTFKELDERARAIVTSGVRVGGAAVTSAGASSDGNSLNIGVDPSTLPSGANVSNDRATLDTIPRSVTGGLPVNLREEGSATDLSGQHGRYRDRSPYFGGSLILTSGGVCTSGFSAFSPQTRRKYLLTAEHCFKGDAADVKNGERTRIGAVIDRQKDYDSALIELPDDGSTTMPFIFRGYRVLMRSTVGEVWGQGRAVVGEKLCVSGSLLGEACGGKVTHVAQWVKGPDGVVRHVDRLEQVAGRYLGGKGDSGGPVFANTVGGISARGVLSMGTHTEACKNPLGGKRQCSEVVWVTNIYEALSSHHGKAGSLRVENF